MVERSSVDQKKDWIQFFNPCGGELVPGYVVNNCISPDCPNPSIPCLAKAASGMAGFILDGSSIEDERNEFGDFLRGGYLGGKVIRTSGETVKLTRENFDSLVGEVVERAQKILEGIDQCIKMTVPLSEDYLQKCSKDQKDTLNKFLEVNSRISSFRGSKNEAVSLVSEMREVLDKVIDLGLGDLGLVVRQSLAYGLGEKILARYGFSGIFVGDLTRLTPNPLGDSKR